MLNTPQPAPCQALTVTANVDHDHAVLALSGDIDIRSADQLLMCIRWYLGEPHITQVEADLHAVTFIDSSGLRALTHGRKRADELGKTFRIRHHHGSVAKLIQMTGLDTYLTDPTYKPDQNGHKP